MFENRVRRKPPHLATAELRQVAQRKLHRQAADDAIANVVLDEPHDFRCGFGELVVIAAVSVPVQHQMCRQDAAAGDRGDVGHMLKLARIPEIANDSQMVERSAKSTAG